MVARTLLQQALPTTFGLKAATWLVGVLEAPAADGRRARPPGRAAGRRGRHAGRPGRARPRGRAPHGGRPRAWRSPSLPWHTSRVRVAALGSALATLAGALGKIALDVVLMAQTEVGELSEPAGEGRGGSSTLAHKRNPVGSTLALACARKAQASADAPDGQPRAGARARGRRLAGRMGRHRGSARGGRRRGQSHGRGARRPRRAPRADARQPRGHARADHVRAARLRARRAIWAAKTRTRSCARPAHGPASAAPPLRDELAADEGMPLSAAELDVAFVPETYVGAADVFIDRALDLYRAASSSRLSWGRRAGSRAGAPRRLR